MAEKTTASETKHRKYARFQQVSDNVFLKVERETFSVSAQILCNASPVFKAMLTGDNFKEGRTREIELPGKSADDIYMMLNLLDPCPEIQKAVDPKVLLPIAEEYQITAIKEECSKVLRSFVQDSRSRVDLEKIYLSERFGLTDVFKQAVDQWCQQESIHEVAGYKEYIQLLTPKTMEQIMSAILENSANALKLKNTQIAEFEDQEFRSEVIQTYMKDACRVLDSAATVMENASTKYAERGERTHTVSWKSLLPKKICRPPSVSGKSKKRGSFQYSVSKSSTIDLSVYLSSSNSDHNVMSLDFTPVGSSEAESHPKFTV